MQKVNVDVYIWNELRSNDRFGLNTQHVGIVVFVGFKPSKTTKTTLYAHVVFVYSSLWYFLEKSFWRRNLCRRIYSYKCTTKHKSAATKFTFAATFCSIIIETRPTEDISQRRTKQLSLE